MGLLDDMFSVKKEAVKPHTARAALSKKEAGRKQVEGNITPSKTSFFGSVRRSSGSLITSTPKNTSTTTKENGGKTKESLELRTKPPDKDRKIWFRSSNNNILAREPIKSPISFLGINTQKSSNVSDSKRRRPITFTLGPNVTVRRGQNVKPDGQNLPDNLSRTSSITNLETEQKLGKGAKPRKSSSRDKIDKIGDNKKNDKKGASKNNNKLNQGESPYPSIDSLQEEEFVQLRRQLQEMAQEKSNLALQLGEQKGQLNILQKEIQNLKSFQEDANLQLEQLTEENTALRNRLRDVAHSPLSDNEKQQLLYETHHRHHSSAPASIATNLIDEGTGNDITACPTPDWDKHSSSNVSEVSVACLQDKINQMQETHYSTNEELQATLQELTDLQRQLTELQQENERLNEEKTLMFDSLCRQTERLNDSRAEVESLKQLLYREKDEAGQYESALEREQKLVALLKSTQEEKQALLHKLEQISSELQEARTGIMEKDERLGQLAERVRTLESTLDAKHAEHKLMDQELAQAKDQCSARQIEINRLTDLLDNARTKINELEQDRALSDKSELDEMLDNARKEKDSLESEVAHLKEQLAISKNEIEKLKEQVSMLQEECKVTRNNARTKQCDLEYKYEKLLMEKNNLSGQLLEFQEAINELQVQSQCQLEDKRQLSSVLSETQRNLSEAERKNLTLETELSELKKVRNEEVEEWEKFQNDLLTSVRVANDFKTEAQLELQRMILENKSYREKERQLKSEIEKLKGRTRKRHSSYNEPTTVLEKSDFDMENLLGLSKNKQRKPKEPAEATQAVKDDKNKPKKPDKTVKKRENKPTRNKKNKTLSVEEELLLKSLNDWYENIDKNLPEDQLTEEQKVVKKLKSIYDDDSLKEKPVAHKPKNLLAISKPLLDSVFLNPKLEEIAKDPTMPTIEETDNSDLLSDNIPFEIVNSPNVTPRQTAVRSVDLSALNEPTRAPVINRSKSCDDLFSLEEKPDPILYRSAETEDLRGDAPVFYVQRDSSILPSDSVSNPRYSDFATVIDNDLRSKRSEPVKLKRKSSVNFESLESVLASIPENATEDELSSEQKFAVRLKKALDEAEKKNTLKKMRKGKQVVISSPTMDSVVRNPKLRDILFNPEIQSVRRNSVIENVEPYFKDPLRQSKSYQDISFSFNASSNDSRSFNTAESVMGDNYGFNRKSSVSETFSSAEFDLESNLVSPFDVKDLKSFRESKMRYVVNENDDRDLLYNETINKKNRLSKSSHVESVESDEADKNQVVTVTTPEEHSVVFEKPQGEGEVQNLKAELSEDETYESQTATITLPEEFTTVRYKPPSEKRRTRIYKVTSVEEEESDRNRLVTVTSVDKHEAVLDQVPTHKVSYLEEEEINRNRLVTVTHMKEYEAVLDQVPTRKVSSLEDEEIDRSRLVTVTPVDKPEEIDRNRFVTVTRVKEHEAFLDQVPSCKVSYLEEEEIGRSRLVTVTSVDEHEAVLDEAPNYKVTSPEEEIDRRRLVTVTSVDKHQADFDQAPDYKVTSSEEEIDRNRLVTVTFINEHEAILDQSVNHKVTSVEEEEINKNQLVTVTFIDEHDAILHQAPDYKVTSLEEEEVNRNPVVTVTFVDEHEAVLFNNSYDKKGLPNSMKQTPFELKAQHEDETDNTTKNSEESTFANPDTFDDFDTSLVSYQPNDDEDDFGEICSAREVSEYEKAFLESLKEEEESHEYDYHSILKENRYGVISPLNIRLSYKDVVKEIKNKFSRSREPSPVVESDEDVDDDYLEEKDTFFSDFFGTGRKTSEATSSEGNALDLEMEQIFEKYLHTPLSKVITEVGSSKAEEEEENQKIEDGTITSATNPAFVANTEDYSKQIERSKVENDQTDDSKRYESQAATKTSRGKENVKLEQRTVETVNENLVDVENSDKQSNNDLTEEELKLLTSIRNVRYSRPLSDLNDVDIEAIEQLTLKYIQNFEEIEKSDSKNDKTLSDNSSLNTETDKDISSSSLKPAQSEEYQEKDRDESFSNEKARGVLQEFEPIEESHRTGDEIGENEDENYLEPSSVKQEQSRVYTALIIENEETIRESKLAENNFSSSNEENKKEHPFENTTVQNRPVIKKPVARLRQNNDTEDDVDKALTKLTTLSNVSKRRMEKHGVTDTDPRSEKPKVVMRNTNFESVKNRFEFLSRDSDLSRHNKHRQSLNPSSQPSTSNRRLVKSWAEHFEKRSLDTSSSYEPVYENLQSLNVKKSSLVVAAKIDKKPLPVPRTRNLGSASVENDSALSDIKNDATVNDIKMSDCKIVSENDESLNQEHPGSNFNNLVLPDIPLYSETSRGLLKELPKETENEEDLKSSVLGIKKSEKFLGHDDNKIKDEPENSASGAASCFSSIAVAGKFEELDLTQHSDDVEEIITTDNESHLNLFHLETPSYDESYLSLFKSPEEKIYEDISGTRRPQKGYINLAYCGEASDTESCEDVTRNVTEGTGLKENVSKPKIIDFVPLDDATKPVYRKDNLKEPNYDTLEREKTFHVLNIAASTGAVRKSVSSTESEAVKTTVSSNSRMSFSAAKKVFESLVESNLDNSNREKPTLKHKSSLAEKSNKTGTGSDVVKKL